MANLLDNYNENLPGEEVVSSNENAAAGKRFRKKDRKVLKAIRKMLKRQNKLIKEELERKKAEREAAEAERAAAQAAKCRNDDRGKGFLNGFAKEICKVLPQIMTAVVTGVLGFFCKRKFSGKVA